MVGSGTIKTLGALLVAMTLGTGVLLWMETDPARSPVPLPLQATHAEDVASFQPLVRDTDVPLQYIKWSNIVVHDTACEQRDIAEGCHFVIAADGQVRSTARWRTQRDGRHIVVPGFSYDANSIGICLAGDCALSPPSPAQFEALAGLVQTIQAMRGLPRDHVYLHRDLGRGGCPGSLFPADEFRRRLLPSAR